MTCLTIKNSFLTESMQSAHVKAPGVYLVLGITNRSGGEVEGVVVEEKQRAGKSVC